MADFTDITQPTLPAGTPGLVDMDEGSMSSPSPLPGLIDIAGGGGAPVVNLLQRIWDSVLFGGAWVQYTKTAYDPAPSSGETQPNHTGNLVASTHQLLAEV
jgi:hypothetical protein